MISHISIGKSLLAPMPFGVRNFTPIIYLLDPIKQRGDEDEGRAGRARRRLSRITERATEVARGLLGRLRRRVV